MTPQLPTQFADGLLEVTFLNLGGGGRMKTIYLLRSYDTFRNLSLIFLKFCIRKEHSTVILKTT